MKLLWIDLYCTGINKGALLPSSTSVFLLNAGSFTTSSYVTRSSWSKTGGTRDPVSERASAGDMMSFRCDERNSGFDLKGQYTRNWKFSSRSKPVWLCLLWTQKEDILKDVENGAVFFPTMVPQTSPITNFRCVQNKHILGGGVNDEWIFSFGCTVPLRCLWLDIMTLILQWNMKSDVKDILMHALYFLSKLSFSTFSAARGWVDDDRTYTSAPGIHYSTSALIFTQSFVEDQTSFQIRVDPFHVVWWTRNLIPSSHVILNMFMARRLDFYSFSGYQQFNFH